LSIKLSEVDKFLIYHSNPLALGSQHISDLEQLIIKFPYCQTLKALLAKASTGTNQYNRNLGIAAAFTSSRENLHHFIQYPEDFVTEINTDVEFVEAKKIVHDDFGQAFGADLNEMFITDKQTAVIEEEDVIPFEDVKENVHAFADVKEQELSEEAVEEITDLEEPDTETSEEIIEEEIQASADVKEQELSEVAVEEITDLEEPESETSEEIIEEEIQASADVEEQELSEEAVKEITDLEEPESETSEEIIEEEIQASADVEEEELSKEVVEDISDVKETESENIEETVEIEQEVQTSADVEEQEISEEVIEDISEVEEPESETSEEQEEVEAFSDVENSIQNDVENLTEEKTPQEVNLKEELVFESASQSDFFAFSKREEPQAEKIDPTGSLQKDQDITQYNDDSMPYTFLWWLNKTRKEHASNARPFAANETVKTRVTTVNPDQDSLNNQIAENIFHLKGAEELAVNSKENFTVPFNFQNRENGIIEKFIKEEPSIKPPAANKIDTENKAKKSSEDTNEVVSETLAKIYVEQMLYHKALDVYKKLSLKFPEKSVYFASQIKYLELKVN
jgi:hypothetical protein